jgi:tyrosine-protein phosphatase YwqE
MNLMTGTKYSGISQIVATNHKNIKFFKMTLCCSKLMRLNEIRNFRKVEIIIEENWPNATKTFSNQTKLKALIK